MNLDELIMRLTHIHSNGVPGDTEVLINHARSPYEPEVDEIGSVDFDKETLKEPYVFIDIY